jgi:hypothetical protein
LYSLTTNLGLSTTAATEILTTLQETIHAVHAVLAPLGLRTPIVIRRAPPKVLLLTLDDNNSVEHHENQKKIQGGGHRT